MKRSYDDITKTDEELREIIHSQKLEESFTLRIQSSISSFLNYYNINESSLTRIEGEININGSIVWKFVVDDNRKIMYNFKLPLNENENSFEKLFLFYISKMNNWNDKIRLYRID